MCLNGQYNEIFIESYIYFSLMVNAILDRVCIFIWLPKHCLLLFPAFILSVVTMALANSISVIIYILYNPQTVHG